MIEDDDNPIESDSEPAEGERESAELLEAEDGFSLEALSKAYARAVAERNETVNGADSAAESGPALDAGDASTSPANANASETEGAEAGGAEAADLTEDDVLDERADNAACPISPKSILEAMLFVGTPDNLPLKNRNLAALMRGVSPKEVTQLTHELNREYEQQGAPYRIKRDGHGYRLELDESYRPVLNRFYGEIKEARLSQSAIDVLSVVAYNQPATKEQVEKIRAKPSGAILLQLERRGLLGREKSNETSRQTVYSTTSRFLELFGLDEIADLPQSQNIDLID